jgi:glutathione S-transferase
MPDPELYSTAPCPFAHRSRLMLAEKSIPFQLVEIDLQNKPANFQTISPYGKIPVLKHGEHYLWESTIINEYLEETFPEPALLPKEPILRAQARIWINFADTRLFAASARLLYGREPQSQTAILEELSEHLLFIEQEGLRKLSAEGPYWLGDTYSLVDLTYYPWFEQLTVLEHFRGFKLPRGLDRLMVWWDAVADRKAVRAIAKAPEYYLEQYTQLAELYGFAVKS